MKKISMIAPSIFGTAWKMKLALIGQALNFSAMLVPVYFSRSDIIRDMVIVAAWTQLIYYTFSFNFPSVYPSIKTKGRRFVSRIASHHIPVLISIVLLFTYLIASHFSSNNLLELLPWIAGSTVSLSLYNYSLAHLVIEGKVEIIARKRLIYGICSWITIFVICEIQLPSLSGNLSPIASYTIAGLYGILSCRQAHSYSLPSKGIIKRALLLNIHQFKIPISTSISLLSFHSLSLFLFTLGPASAAWAIVIRITGGTGNVGQQIFGPKHEIELSSWLRSSTRFNEEKMPHPSKSFREATTAGILIGILGALLTVCALYVSEELSDIDSTSAILLIMSASFYGIFTNAISATNKDMLMLNGQKQFLILSSAKLLVVIMVLMQTIFSEKFILITVIEIIYVYHYIRTSKILIKRKLSQSLKHQQSI